MRTHPQGSPRRLQVHPEVLQNEMEIDRTNEYIPNISLSHNALRYVTHLRQRLMEITIWHDDLQETGCRHCRSEVIVMAPWRISQPNRHGQVDNTRTDQSTSIYQYIISFRENMFLSN